MKDHSTLLSQRSPSAANAGWLGFGEGGGDSFTQEADGRRLLGHLGKPSRPGSPQTGLGGGKQTPAPINHSRRPLAAAPVQRKALAGQRSSCGRDVSTKAKCLVLKFQLGRTGGLFGSESSDLQPPGSVGFAHAGCRGGGADGRGGGEEGKGAEAEGER